MLWFRYMWSSSLFEVSAIHETVSLTCVSVLMWQPKTGNLALSTMSSSRVFIDKDIQPTIDYFSWLVILDTACQFQVVFCLVFFEWALLNLCFVYCLRLSSNPQIGKQVNADEVTRVETMTIGQIFAYIKQEYAKVNRTLRYLC